MFSLFCSLFLHDLFTKIIIYLVIEQEEGKGMKKKRLEDIAKDAGEEREREREKDSQLTIPLCAFFK